MIAKAQSPQEPGTEPKILDPHLSNHSRPLHYHQIAMKSRGNVSDPPLVLVHTEDEKLLLLPVTPLDQVAEVCGLDLSVPTLLMTQASVKMTLHDSISAFSICF